MKYPTYIDPPRRHIRIHKERCGLVRPKVSDEQGAWFEDFDSVEAAEKLEREKGCRIHFCKRCFSTQ